MQWNVLYETPGVNYTCEMHKWNKLHNKNIFSYHVLKHESLQMNYKPDLTLNR